MASISCANAAGKATRATGAPYVVDDVPIAVMVASSRENATTLFESHSSTPTPAMAYVVVVPEAPGTTNPPHSSTASGISHADTVNEMPTHVNATNSFLAVSMGHWTSEWYDCVDSCVPNCLMAFCCTWVTLFQVAVRIGAVSKRNGVVFAVLLGMLTVGYPVAYYTWIMPVSWHDISDDDQWTTTQELKDGDRQMQRYLEWWNFALAAIYLVSLTYVRNLVRIRFHIPGGFCSDCCLSCWCRWCIAAQLATQVQSYRAGTCSFGPPDVLPQYIVEEDHHMH